MRYFGIFLAIFLYSVQLFSQSSASDQYRDIKTKIRINDLLNQQDNKVITAEQIGGSPYLSKSFIKSVIIRTDSSKIDNVALRYNIYSNQMEFREKETTFFIPDVYRIDRIIMGNMVFVYAQYMTSRNIKASWFQQLTIGRYQLLKKYHVVFKNSDLKSDIHDSARFEPAPPSYFFRYRDGMAHQITSEKKLIKFLQPVPNEIVDYINQKKIDPRNECQLIDLMNYTEKITP